MKVDKLYSAVYGTGAGSGYPFGSLIDNDKSRVIPVGEESQLTVNDGVLIIWGGSDIHPSLYHMDDQGSYVGQRPSLRDEREVQLINKAFALGMPVLGVCRGAQLCCALAGGKLAQDVGGHQGDHYITTKDGITIVTSSVHHQMMYPFAVEHELIAWSKRSLSKWYRGLDEKEIDALEVEPEIVYFPKQKFLAVQGHPEFMPEGHEFNRYVRQLVLDYLGVPQNAPA